MFSFTLSCCTALIFLVLVLRSKLDQSRGAVSVSKVVRDTLMNRVQSMAIWLSLLCGIFFTLTASAGDNQWWAGIPNFVVVVIGFVFQFQSNRSVERVENTRAIMVNGAESVDATLEVAGNTVGGIAGAALPGISAAEGQKALGSVGDALGDIVASGTRAMPEYQNVTITSSDIVDKVDVDAVTKAGVAIAATKMGSEQAIASVVSEQFDSAVVLEGKGFTQEEFMHLAQKAGATIEGRTVDQIVDELYRYIPANYKDTHKDMSTMDVVCSFLKGRS